MAAIQIARYTPGGRLGCVTLWHSLSVSVTQLTDIYLPGLAKRQGDGCFDRHIPFGALVGGRADDLLVIPAWFRRAVSYLSAAARVAAADETQVVAEVGL
jgi:hypothetical protein